MPDIKYFDMIKNPKSNATELAQQYDSVLSTLIDLHAPLPTKRSRLLSMHLYRAVGYLRQTRSRYLRCLLEANWKPVIFKSAVTP